MYTVIMKNDIYGQQIYSEDEIVEIFLSKLDHKSRYILTKDEIFFDDFLNLQNLPVIKKYQEPALSRDDFDKECQKKWFIPDHYKNFDIAKFILDQCENEAELQRAGQELILFQEKGMFDLLIYLKYLIDTFRQNKIVWGVGRGSSVASFVLFLIGVHRINSLHYDLDVSEFLK